MTASYACVCELITLVWVFFACNFFEFDDPLESKSSIGINGVVTDDSIKFTKENIRKH